MPRNGSGVYSLPSGNPVVDGTAIEAGWANPTLADIGNEITNSLPRSGTAPMAGPLGMGGYKISNVGAAVSASDAVIKSQLDAVSAAIQSLYPVGSVYINAGVATNPATLLGFGTWAAFGAGKVLIGLDAADPSFDLLGETGGSKDAIAVAHTHSFSATSGGQSADHTHTGYTDAQGAHTHSYTAPTFGSPETGYNTYTYVATGSIAANTGSSGSHSHNVQTYGASAGHTHSVSGTTGSTGAAGTNANLQPYVVVHMWKRTA